METNQLDFERCDKWMTGRRDFLEPCRVVLEYRTAVARTQNGKKAWRRCRVVVLENLPGASALDTNNFERHRYHAEVLALNGEVLAIGNSTCTLDDALDRIDMFQATNTEPDLSAYDKDGDDEKG